jgi:hypothetical protein
MIVARPIAAHVVRTGNIPVSRGKMRPMAPASSAMPIKVEEYKRDRSNLEGSEETLPIKAEPGILLGGYDRFRRQCSRRRASAVLNALVKLYVQELVEIQEPFGTHFEISGRALGVIHGDRARTRNDLRNGTLRNA